jgi:hypothetical protein
MYDQLILILRDLTGRDDEIAHQIVTDKIMELVKSEIEVVREEAADDKLWDYQDQQLQDLLWQSRTTGKPDMFSDELRSFWDNGTWENV